MSAGILIYISLIISIFAIFFSIYAVIASGKIRAWRKFFGPDHDPIDLEDIIEQLVEKLKELESHSESASKLIESIQSQLNTSTQHVAVVRYNNNGDDGGNLSFSAALLNAHQTGIIITSLHGRQQNRIYAKVINQGSSESTLSEEEHEALIQALTSKSNK